MTDPYIAQDILDQATEAIRQGRRLEDLAALLRCSPEHLARLLNLPSTPAAKRQRARCPAVASHADSTSNKLCSKC